MILKKVQKTKHWKNSENLQIIKDKLMKLNFIILMRRNVNKEKRIVIGRAAFKTNYDACVSIMKTKLFLNE